MEGYELTLEVFESLVARKMEENQVMILVKYLQISNSCTSTKSFCVSFCKEEDGNMEVRSLVFHKTYQKVSTP